MMLAHVEYIFLRFIKQLFPLKAIHCYAPEGSKMDYLGGKKKKSQKIGQEKKEES